MSWVQFTLALLEQGFKAIGPMTFIYQDEVDTITFFTNKNVVIITHDGETVVKNFQMKQVRADNFYNPESSFFWDEIYQDVLSRF